MQIGGVSCDHPEHQVGIAKVVALADVTAFGVYMGLWFPDVERWVWILAVVTVWLMTLSSHARMKRESGTVPFRVSGRDRFVVTKIYYVGNCWGIGGDMRNFAGCASGLLALGARRRCGANP